MLIETCRPVLTNRCRLVCRQRGRQHVAPHNLRDKPPENSPDSARHEPDDDGGEPPGRGALF
jgi:hypothetical protein